MTVNLLSNTSGLVEDISMNEVKLRQVGHGMVDDFKNALKFRTVLAAAYDMISHFSRW